MIGRSFIIRNRIGLHARPASVFVQTVNRFASRVMVESGGQRADARNAFDVLALNVGRGMVITIEIDGPDEAQAMQAIADLIENRFGEKE